MSTVTTITPPDQYIRIPNVSWRFYESLLHELGERRFRVTFDRGDLELMPPSYHHERCSRLLGRMVNVLASEFELPIKSAGSTTLRREILKRGLEPDECFYIANVSQILGNETLDLERDPPPDLAIEIDITHGSINRLPIYAELGIPEVWRFRGGQLLAYHLGEAGEYEEPVSESRTFPGIPLTGFAEFVSRSSDMDDGTLLKEFRVWIRHTIPSDADHD